MQAKLAENEVNLISSLDEHAGLTGLNDEQLSALIQAVGLFVRRVRMANRGHEHSLPELAVLSRVESTGPCSVADLARAEGMRPQSMGPVVAGLIEAGLLERAPHPTDRRQWQVSLTEKGVAARKAARDTRREWLAKAAGKLSKADQAVLVSATPLLRKLAGE